MPIATTHRMISDLGKPTAERERLLAEMRQDVAARLGPVCAGWAEAEVASLVEQIARITYKYDVARTELLFSWYPADDDPNS